MSIKNGQYSPRISSSDGFDTSSLSSSIRKRIGKVPTDLDKFNNIKDLNWAWAYEDPNQGWVQFGCLQCMLIESKYKQWVDNDKK